MVMSTFLMVRTWVASRVFSIMSPVVLSIWTRSPMRKARCVGEQDSGDDVGDGGRGAERKQHAEKDGNAAKGGGVRAGQVGEGENEGEGEEEDLQDAVGGHRPLGVKAAEGDGAAVDLAEKEAGKLVGLVGEESDDDEDEQAGQVVDEGGPARCDRGENVVDELEAEVARGGEEGKHERNEEVKQHDRDRKAEELGELQEQARDALLREELDGLDAEGTDAGAAAIIDFLVENGEEKVQEGEEDDEDGAGGGGLDGAEREGSAGAFIATS